MNQIEAVKAASVFFGNQARLARALGVTPVTVGQWLKPDQPTGREVPPKQCVRIERLTKGEVSRQALRPLDYFDIWPELAQAKPLPATAATDNVAEGGV